MSSGRKDHTAGEWHETSAGRPYRYIDIEGVRFIQWDHVKGPVVVADGTTPRTPDPRNLSGTRTSLQSTATRPTPVGHNSQNASGPNAPLSAQTRESDLTAYSSYPHSPYPPEGHQPLYTLFPRESRQPPSISYSSSGISQQQASATLSSLEDNEYDEAHKPLPNVANGINPRRHAAPESLPRNTESTHQPGQTKTDQPEYPPGTRKIIRKPDRTYYLDGDGKVISVVAPTRQEPRVDRGKSSPDDVTNQFATMNTQSKGLGESKSDRPSRYTADPHDEPQGPGSDPYGLSARPQIARHGSQGSAYGPREERSQSRERARVHQHRPAEDRESSRDLKGGIDAHLSNRPAQDPQRHSVQEAPGPGGLIDTTRGQSQRPTGNETIVSNDKGIGTRRPSVTQRTGLETISELGTYKATRITGDNKYGRSKETIDDRYVTRKDAKNFFVLGRVFALLWHENAGTEGTDLSDGGFYPGRYGEKVYSTIRRMVVVNVKPKHGHCTCVPIATYGGQGTLKAGLSPADIVAHAVIHMVGTSSDADPKEKIVKQPIAVKPAREDQKLHRMSRINFDKIYTIEHNVKVMNVGKVVDESVHNLSIYFYNTHFGV